jgi:hypothetical protein
MKAIIYEKFHSPNEPGPLDVEKPTPKRQRSFDQSLCNYCNNCILFDVKR